jgi:hypothetical protein
MGRTIAQAVSRWLPTAAARVRARVRLCGICGGQSGTGAGFLRILRFPLPILISPIAPQSPSSIIWGWYNRSVAATVPSGLSLTPLRIRPPHFTNHYSTRWVFSVCCVFTSRFLVTASNSGGSSASALTSLPAGCQLHRLSLLFTDSLTTDSQLTLLKLTNF